MKIGMIGIGDIAKKAYLPILTQVKGIELSICTRNKNTLKEIKEQYKIQEIYQDLTSLIQSGIKAAFIHTATNSHEEIIDQLLDHDIHVYVDKPITYNEASSTRLVEKAKEKGLLLMVGFNRRFAPSYQSLREIDKPNLIIMQKNRGHQATDIRTFIFDDFIHVIDTLLYLYPYKIENMDISGKKIGEDLHHVILQFHSKQGTAIGIMNREAGTTEEKLEIMSQEETRVVLNVNQTSVHQNKNVTLLGQNDWESTLRKRGFNQIISTFLDAVGSNQLKPKNYERDLLPHIIAEKIVKELM